GQRTPLNRQLNRLSKLIGKIGFILSGAIMTILLLKAIFLGDLFAQAPLQIFETVLHIFMLSVAIIVMAVPEGLPMAITLSLAMSMRRMLKTNNLVRKMHACETMGAVTVICTDKTGTLTQNRMRVGEMILCQGVAQCPAPHDELARQIALNSTAFLDKDNRVLGNSTEGALLLWIKDNSDLDYQTLRDRVHIRARQTFSTETKYMATITEHRKHKNRRLLVKGAPESVLGMCRNVENEAEIRSRLLAFQERGMRTLALAMAVPETDIISEEIARRELTLSAIVAISDPVREDVPAAVQECLDAGIKVKIVTGDTAATAREIARQIGLWNDEVDGPTSLMTGDEFAAMSDEELLERVTTLKILSRARPLDKQRLVRLLQRKNEVVAVTGDGTNDAPALNFANVGLSMGSGTSVAKEASDITLLDDSFKSIATAVMWGRSLYRNIQRFVLFQLTINVVAIVICFVGAIIESVIPLTVPQILWVNIIMDTFAAMAFSSLPPSKEVMQERPRRHSDFIVSKNMAGMIFGIGGVMVAVLLAMLLHWEVPTLPQLTYFFSIFIFMQFWNMLNAKAFESGHSGFTHWKGCGEFVAIMGLIALGQYIIVELGGDIFRTEPLMALEWVLVIVPTMLIAVGGNLIIYLFRRYKR
ncbi:MAG: calcium-translocating P-type ATPase, PMCA-type, partial [Alistipes sp.]|nr:calcium-translocating P-type ATPase, PMCA-type [Alistipes sp.]